MIRTIMCPLDTPELRQAALADTRLIVSISFPATSIPPQIADQTSELQRTTNIINCAIQRTIAGEPGSDEEEWKEMADLQVEARAWADMPRVAGCEIRD
jgi:hypothetical protein